MSPVTGVFVILACFPLPSRAVTRLDSGLLLKASVITAFENGPLVAEFELRNTGEVDRTIADIAPRVMGPSHWNEPLVLGAGVISGQDRVATRVLPPGGRVARFVALDSRFTSIPAGHALLRVDWNPVVDLRWLRHGQGGAEGQKGAPQAELLQTVLLVVEPSRKDSLNTLCERLARVVDSPGRTPMDLELVVAHVRSNYRVQLAPVMSRLINAVDSDGLRTELTEKLIGGTISDEKSVSVVVNHLRAPTPRAGVEAFRFIAADKQKRAMFLARLLDLRDSACLEVRILTYVTFPKNCDPSWSQAVLSDVRRFYEPISARQFTTLLKNLGDDRFAVRQNAQASIERHGERIELMVSEAMKSPLPAEAVRRLRRALINIQEDARHCSVREVLPYLEALGTGEAIVVLRTLASGPEDARLTREASASLERLRSKP